VRRQLGAELRKLRSLAGLSQRVLVDALRSSQAGISRIEHGEALPSREQVLTWLPGLLQTAEYARLVIEQTDPDSERDTPAALAARIQRQQILFESGRRFEFLIGDAALLWEPGPGVMDAQRDRLLSLATLPSVEIAVLPARRTGTPAWHGFIQFQDGDGSSCVTTELVHGGQEITEPDAVRRYVALWDRLWKAAATGSDATDLIRGRTAP
jgi:transcriptional regulator with XRE-family HTH domain